MIRSNSTPALPVQSPPSPSVQRRISLPLYAQEAISELSPAARERLRSLFQARAEMLPISVSSSQPQAPADPWMIFELRKSGSTYALAPTTAGPSLVPNADGMFLYVVCADDPGRVYVGAPYGRTGIDSERFGIQGHTSLTARAEVLYAGEIVLQQGNLVSWGNGSGHYRPRAELRHTNLLPVTQALLPEASFTDYWHHDNAARQAELAQLRGYLNMIDPHAPAASSEAPSRSQRLRLQVGNSDMALSQVAELGALIDGEPLQAALRRSTSPASLQDGLADRLSFDGDMLEGQLRTQRIADIEDLLFELAAQRGVGTPLVVDPGGRPRAWISQANAILARVQTLAAMSLYEPRRNSVICLLPGGSPIRHTALGLHLFGLYNGLRTLRTSLARGNITDAVVAGSELAATGTSVVAENGLQRLGAVMQSGTVPNMNRFARTSIGRRLGGPARLGSNLARSAPLVGALITTPFDAYNAISSFSQAAQSSGRQAQDHYVDGGVATASLVTTLGLGVAASAGFASAGPVGLAAGVLLVVGSRTYHSVRYVEELQKQIPLSMGEVVSTGLLNVIGLNPTQEVRDRQALSVAAQGYRHEMQQHLQSSLAPLARLGVSHAIFGDAIITLRPPLYENERGTHSIAGGAEPATHATEVPQPPLVIANSGDDDIDPGRGMHTIRNMVSIASATDDKVLWMTGTGDDKLVGFWHRSNLFDVRAGKKTLLGSNQPDRFDLQVAPGDGSSFDGGLGDDMLLLSFAAPSDKPVEVALAGHLWRDKYRHVEDHAGDNYQKAGSRNWLCYPRDLPGAPWHTSSGWIQVGSQRSTLISLENVVTAPNATTKILGNGQDNVFVLNGRDDSVDGGLGNDTYIVQGGGTVRVKAGAGGNRYQLQHTIERVEIDSARLGQHTLHLDFYLHELLFEARGQSVEISVVGSPEQRIVLADIYQTLENGQREAVRSDGQVRIMTRDAIAVTPLFSRCLEEDGLVELLVKSQQDPALPQQQRFATAHDIQQLDLLVAASGGWHSDTGLAPAASGSLPGNANEVLRESMLGMAA